MMERMFEARAIKVSQMSCHYRVRLPMTWE
jgi:hypothetical protein